MDRILIVDDDSDAGEAMSEALTSRGFEVSLAADGKRALAALRAAENLPSLILLDLMMPVMNGWQFRRIQLEDERLAKVPVIIVTGAVSDASGVAQLHPFGFLKKPVVLANLLEAVSNACA